MTTSMEGKLSKKELHTALFFKMHSNSAPGLDGFIVNWLRTFWPELADIRQNAINDCFEDNRVTGLPKTAVVRILRKEEPKIPLSQNITHFTILSVHYKLACCAITQRIKPAVNKVVRGQQKVM